MGLNRVVSLFSVGSAPATPPTASAIIPPHIWSCHTDSPDTCHAIRVFCWKIRNDPLVWVWGSVEREGTNERRPAAHRVLVWGSSQDQLCCLIFLITGPVRMVGGGQWSSVWPGDAGCCWLEMAWDASMVCCWPAWLLSSAAAVTISSPACPGLEDRLLAPAGPNSGHTPVIVRPADCPQYITQDIKTSRDNSNSYCSRPSVQSISRID